MKKAISVMMACFFFFMAVAHAQEVKVDESIKYYEIFGNRAEQLLKEMQTKAPPSPFGGKRYFAKAEGSYEWTTYPDFWARPCKIDSFEIVVTVEYLLPLWREKARAGKRLVGYWEEFSENLWVHEKGHGDIAVEIGVNIARSINKISRDLSCEAFNEEAERRMKDIWNNSTAQHDYDMKTEHGKLQGAYFDVAAAKRYRKKKADSK